MFEIGSSLREARTRQGLDFPELEQRTKIRGKYLRALEDEQFSVLPGHSYIKGFLHAYANALGLDGNLYVDEYNSRYLTGEEEPPARQRRPAPARSRRRERRESHALLLALGAIVVVTALVIAAWRFGGAEEQLVPGLGRSTTSTTTTSARRVVVVIRAVSGPTYAEVRRNSETGPPLFLGTLERGQVQRFRGPTLYVAFRAPANVAVKLNGNRVLLPAGGEAVITRQGARAPAGS